MQILKVIFPILLLFLVFFNYFSVQALAVEDPLLVPNNKFGIHILFSSELEEAARLINSNGGDWGYVVIPIQSGDKDIVKWQEFMDKARKHHIIPIVRLATEGDYFNTEVWRKPEPTDIVDFANFLNSLNWPTKNRYITVFNEVNRANEWEGKASPAEYAEILSYAVSVFKSKSPDFFIISAGMDNAAATGNGTYSQYDFYRGMHATVPGIFNQIDGHGSHSYPNPAFAQPPTIHTAMSITSFRFEKQLLESLGAKENLPVFITETGWSTEAVSDSLAASYYKTAFSDVWSDASIVAVTPFLLRAGAGPFIQFSFINASGAPAEQYKAFSSIPKVKGRPHLAPELKKTHKGVLADSTQLPLLEMIGGNNKQRMSSIVDSEDIYRAFLKWTLKMK